MTIPRLKPITDQVRKLDPAMWPELNQPEASKMNPLREAAIAIHEAEKAHAGLLMRMDVSHRYIHITADMGELQMSRSVTWDAIEQARINLLTAEVALLTNKITSPLA